MKQAPGENLITSLRPKFTQKDVSQNTISLSMSINGERGKNGWNRERCMHERRLQFLDKIKSPLNGEIL